MKLKYLIITLAILGFSCNNNTWETNSPLVSIIKLNSAEELGDFEEAVKYQNISKLYGGYAREKSITPEAYWKAEILANNDIAKDKRFTNRIKYFNYDISENILDSNAEVIFKNKNHEARIREIIYKLELLNAVWVVQEIEYNLKK